MLRICGMVHLSIYAFFYCIDLLNKYTQVLGEKKPTKQNTQRILLWLYSWERTHHIFWDTIQSLFLKLFLLFFFFFLLLLQLSSARTHTNSVKSTNNTGLIKLHFLSKNYLLNNYPALVSTCKHFLTLYSPWICKY